VPKHIIEAGCDGATLCAFDAAALPKDFDAISADDPMDVMLSLQDEQRFWVGGTGEDGRYVFHIYVDEPAETLPDTTSAFVKVEADFTAFECPSGVMWICGAEYAAKNPKKGNATTPDGMSLSATDASFRLPKGRHRIKITSIDYEDSPHQIRFQWHSLVLILAVLMIVLGAIGGVLSTICLIISLLGKLIQLIMGSPLLYKGWHAFPIILAIMFSGALIFFTGIKLNKFHSSLKSVVDANREYEQKRRQRPDFVIEINTVPKDSAPLA